MSNENEVQALETVIQMLDQSLVDRMYVKGQYVDRLDAIAEARASLATLAELKNTTATRG